MGTFVLIFSWTRKTAKAFNKTHKFKIFLAEEVVKLIGDINDLIKEVENYSYGQNLYKKVFRNSFVKQILIC